jgi:hypothetical protein
MMSKSELESLRYAISAEHAAWIAVISYVSLRTQILMRLFSVWILEQL